jgi:branched-chain amino acid transport system ATP-binding protein
MLLELSAASASYGKAQVLHSVDLGIAESETISLVGRNGAGKSTIMRCLCGLMPIASGRLLFEGKDVTGAVPHLLSRRGINYVNETRRIFPNLSVRENLEIATYAHAQGQWTIARVLEIFPRLGERIDAMGDALSGGEQQMLAIGRGLLTAPRIILLDEPTEGLAPRVVEDLVSAIRQIQREGVAAVLVEQNFKVPLALAARQYVIDNGRLIWSGTTDDLVKNRVEIEALLGF